jgi:hypothetical protein
MPASSTHIVADDSTVSASAGVPLGVSPDSGSNGYLRTT